MEDFLTHRISNKVINFVKKPMNFTYNLKSKIKESIKMFVIYKKGFETALRYHVLKVWPTISSYSFDDHVWMGLVGLYEHPFADRTGMRK